jgi:hypothetical protein
MTDIIGVVIILAVAYSIIKMQLRMVLLRQINV